MNKLSCFYGLGVYWGIKILLFQLIPYGFYPPADILPGDFRTDGFFKRHIVGRKAVYPTESGIQQGLGIAGFSGTPAMLPVAFTIQMLPTRFTAMPT